MSVLLPNIVLQLKLWLGLERRHNETFVHGYPHGIRSAHHWSDEILQSACTFARRKLESSKMGLKLTGLPAHASRLSVTSKTEGNQDSEVPTNIGATGAPGTKVQLFVDGL